MVAQDALRMRSLRLVHHVMLNKRGSIAGPLGLRSQQIKNMYNTKNAQFWFSKILG